MLTIPKKIFLYCVVALTAIISDQISKIMILNHLSYKDRINIIPDFFDLTLVYNQGAAFSFLANQGGWQKYFFLLLAALICSYLVYAIAKKQFGFIGSIGASAVIGGAIGNVVDRLIHGHVIDFLLFYWQNHFYPAFNIADSFICVGAVLLVWDGFLQGKTGK